MEEGKSTLSLQDVITEYTQEDFLMSEEPYREVYAYKDEPFMHRVKIKQMTEQAKKVGVTDFKGLYKGYIESMQLRGGANIVINNPTNFSGGAYMQLEAGKYNVDDGGVYLAGLNGLPEHIICHHPIIPFECLQNIDTGEEKLNIAYRSRGEWRELVVPKEILYNSKNISQLVKHGVDVSSETAKDLVSYFQEIESLNRDAIPLKKSVGRLGYIGEAGFSPYVDDLLFDGDEKYSHIFKQITEKGSFERWLNTANECRKMSVTARIMLAASFASPLLLPLGALPFFVHLWGIDSSTGKSVSLMLAASVWGNPAIGEYIQTFNSTNVGMEKVAAFLNNIPFCIDELQLSKDSHGKSNFDVYQLAQGVGRTRGTKTGGIERTPTWRNAILTTGESPIVKSSAGAGAVNRVIEIECTSNNKVIFDGQRISKQLSKDYGFAGKIFIKKITSKGVMKKAQEIYDDFFKKLCELDTTDKQAMAAAAILTADLLANAAIFKDDFILTVDEISPFLQTKKAVSAGERGYQFMCDWVAANSKRFVAGEDNTGEVYGIIQDNYAYIIRSKFSEVAQKQGFDERALLSWLKSNNKILTRKKNNTRGKRINGVNVECVVMKLPEEEPEYYTSEELDSDVMNGFEPL